MSSIRPIYPPGATGASGRPSSYQVRYRDADGRQRTKGGFRRRRDAEAFAADVEARRNAGTLIAHGDSAVRFEVVATAWLQSIQDRRKPRTVDGYEKLLELHVRPAFGPRKVGSITYADVDGFVRRLEAGGRKAGTVRNTYFVLKMVLDYAVRDQRIRSNPCVGIDLPSPASPEMLFLTPKQVRELAAHLELRAREMTEPKPYGLLVEFAAFTGLRVGEIAALRVHALDLRRGSVSVLRAAAKVKGQIVEGEPKTKAGRRVVFVNRALADRLKEHLGARIFSRDAYVFASGDGGPLNYGSFYSGHFKKAVRAVLPPHLHPLRFHDLRHTYASMLVEHGAHPKEMAELLGHSSVQVTLDRYSHVMPHLSARLADRMDEAYRDAAPPDAGDADAGPGG